MNASSQRSGRLILSQLREATQSHQVDSQGVNAHKPSFFNSYGSSSAGSLRPGSSPSKQTSRRCFTGGVIVKEGDGSLLKLVEIDLWLFCAPSRKDKLPSEGGFLSSETSPVPERSEERRPGSVLFGQIL